jgi:hypothetical protein
MQMDLTLIEALRLPIGYGAWVPKPGDEDIRRALAGLANAPDSARAAVAAQFTEPDRDCLDAYAERMASLAVRERRLDLVISGLDAMDMAHFGLDWSESISMPLLFRACELLGGDARAEFVRAATRLHGVVRDGALELAAGQGPSLEDCGFAEGRDDEGFRFVLKSSGLAP